MSTGEPSTALVLGTLLLGLLTSVFWPLSRYLITMAHEGSHAFAGSAAGGRVDSVTFKADGTGLTGITGANAFITAMAGYVGPSLFGILGATLLAHGVHPDVILWVSLALMVLILLQMTNVFGFLAVVVFGFLTFMVAHYGTPLGRAVTAYTWIWFLLIGGVVQTVQTNLKKTGWSGDGKLLRDMTKLPSGFWGVLWWLATLAAFGYGAALLLGLVEPVLSGRTTR
jgi:hypothetical protein